MISEAALDAQWNIEYVAHDEVGEEKMKQGRTENVHGQNMDPSEGST